jgi:hypothetical protein
MNMKRRLIPLALCIALAAAVAPMPRAAHALDDGGTTESFNSEKFWTYAACGASIALATGTVGGWVLVGIACGKAATTYWTT